MSEYVWQIIVLISTSSCGWFFGKLQTKREQKQSDLQIIEEAVSPLLTSIKDLTEHNNRLVEQYLEEQKQRPGHTGGEQNLKAERAELAEQVSRLTVKVEKLERTIKRLARKMKKIVCLTISIATFGCNASRHTVKVRRGDRRAHGHRNRRHRKPPTLQNTY